MTGLEIMHDHNQLTATRPTQRAPSERYEPTTKIPVYSRSFGSWHLSLQRQPLGTPELTHRYDREASRWSKVLARFGVPHAYESLLRGTLGEAVSAVAGTPPRVLECGIGTGALSAALEGVLPAGASIDAIDISPAMLEQAHTRFRDSALNVTLRKADIRELPYANDRFDIAMTAHVLEHLVSPGEALREMSRVLKPGGLLIACITRRSALGMAVHVKWRTHRVTPAQAKEWLIDSGFEHVRCLAYGEGSIVRHLSVACIGRKPLLAHRPDGLSNPD